MPGKALPHFVVWPVILSSTHTVHLNLQSTRSSLYCCDLWLLKQRQQTHIFFGVYQEQLRNHFVVSLTSDPVTGPDPFICQCLTTWVNNKWLNRVFILTSDPVTGPYSFICHCLTTWVPHLSLFDNMSTSSVTVWQPMPDNVFFSGCETYGNHLANHAHLFAKIAIAKVSNGPHTSHSPLSSPFQHNVQPLFCLGLATFHCPGSLLCNSWRYVLWVRSSFKQIVISWAWIIDETLKRPPVNMWHVSVPPNLLWFANQIANWNN